MSAKEASAEARTGGCLCGAVRFSATPKSANAGACHCGMCRRWGGGPFMHVQCAGPVIFENEAHLGVYRSSQWAERGFCKQCGSSLYYRLAGKEHYSMNAAAFDEPGALRLGYEVFIDEKPDYYAFSGERKRMTSAEVFALFSSMQAGGDG